MFLGKKNPEIDFPDFCNTYKLIFELKNVIFLP